MMGSFRVRFSTEEPPSIFITEIGPNDQDYTLAPEVQSIIDSIEGAELWEHCTDSVYSQKLPLAAFTPVLLVEFTNLNCRFWLHVTICCTGQWFHEALLAENPTQTATIFHEFFASDLVPVASSTFCILESLVRACRVPICQDPESHLDTTVLTIHIYLELDMDNAVFEPSPFMQIHVCQYTELEHIFHTLCGAKLRKEFRLTRLVPHCADSPGTQYSYRMATSQKVRIMDTPWMTPGLQQRPLLCVLPFPCGMTKYLRRGWSMGGEGLDLINF